VEKKNGKSQINIKISSGDKTDQLMIK